MPWWHGTAHTPPTNPADPVEAAIMWTTTGIGYLTPPDCAEQLRTHQVFTDLCWRDAQRVADIIIEHAFRFWRYSYDNPEFNLLLNNRATCATGRLDGIDWADPDKVNHALTIAADALQPNITVGSSSWVT
jgi:hypothetical protein